MNWPRKIDVTINYGSEDTDDRRETTATLLRAVETYGEFGPMAEYESASGSRFWIEGEYFKVCRDTNRLPDIPIEVIRKNEEWLQKKAMGERALKQQAAPASQSGLILPPDFEIPKV